MGPVKSFFDTFYRIFFTQGWPIATIGIVVTLLVLSLVAAILWGLFYLIDTCFLPTEQDAGVINGKDYEPSSFMLMPIGGVLIPYPTDDEWDVSVNIGNKSGWMDVGQEFYAAAYLGMPVTARYSIRRFTRKLLIKELSAN